MKKIANFIFGVGLFLVATSSQAQQAILQGGPWIPNHVPIYVDNGYSQPIVQDGGPAGGSSTSLGLSELLMTQQSPTNQYPSNGTGTGPFGTNSCNYDAPLTNPTGYHFLCMSPNTGTGALITYGAGGGATPGIFTLRINGVDFTFPGAGTGNVSGPNISTIGHIATWGNTSGTLLQDGGALGTAAFQNTGTSGSNIPLLSTANTWTLPQTFTANPIFPSQTANTFLAAPNGSNGMPSFRALVPQDSAAGVVEYDLYRNSIANNPLINFFFSGSSFSASGTAGTTCGGSGTFNFPCLQNYNITGDTVDASTAGALDGWQFTNSFGGPTVKGARQSVDIISTFTAPTSVSNGNRNYVPFATYMQINSGDGGTALTPQGSWFGANHVVRGNVTYAANIAGQENDIGVFGTMYWRLGYSAVSFPGNEGSNTDAAFEVGAASGASATNWVNALFLSNGHGLAPLSTGGCVICTDGSADTIAQGIDLHTYTINGYFLRSQNFSVDGTGAATAVSYRLSNMVSTTSVPTIASGFCTSPSLTAANGTAAFKITVGSGCAAGNGTLTMPVAANDWVCSASDLTNPSSHVIAQAAHSTTSVGFSDFSRTTGAPQNMGSGDVILVQCSAL